MTLGERSMAKMVNFGIAYGLSDFGLSEPGEHPARRGAGVHQHLLRDLLRDQLLHARDQGAGADPGLRHDAARPQARRSRSSRARNPTPARGGRADGDQHADPGHRRRHRQDRDDPARRAAARPAASGPGRSSRSTTSCCSRCRATRSTGSCPVLRETMEGALPLDVPLTVDIKVGDDWESMTPLTRADAIAAEADEAPELEAPARADRSGSATPMPELPEVETVARDLRPRIVGATITGARCSWARTLRTHTPEAFAAAIAGRRVEGVGRRAKLVVVELSGDAALTIHLKMTGQLFVVPAERAGGPVRPARPRAGRRPRAPLPRHPQVREGRAVRPRPGHRRAGRPRSAARRSSPRSGPEPLDPAFTVRDVPAPAPAPEGPAQAAPARPVVPRRGRQHLRRRGALGGPAPSAADGRHAPARRRAPPVRGDPHDPGRGRRAARQLDRRLHRARRRRLDAGAPAGLPADRRAVPALRPADQADRHRRAVARTSARGASGCRRADRQGRGGDPADDDRRAAPDRAALDRAGGGGDLGLTPGEAARGRGPGTDRADEAGRGDAPGGGARVGVGGSDADEHPAARRA